MINRWYRIILRVEFGNMLNQLSKWNNTYFEWNSKIYTIKLSIWNNISWDWNSEIYTIKLVIWKDTETGIRKYTQSRWCYGTIHIEDQQYDNHWSVETKRRKIIFALKWKVSKMCMQPTISMMDKQHFSSNWNQLHVQQLTTIDI